MTIFSIPLYLSIIYVTSYEIPQYLFKKHSIFELLFSFFYVNWLIYKAIIFRASFAMSDKNPYGILSALQLDGDFVSPYPRPQPKMCVLVPICMVTA